MKFSENWLRKWVDPDIDSAVLQQQLTNAGLEVDYAEPVAADFTRVVVAEITDVQSHPDAERLRVCRVRVSQQQTVTIVTNVADVVVGMKVPCALDGAELPGLEIKTTKLRGVTSQGMFCGADTLGVGESNGGLLQLPADAPVGQDIRKYLKLNDVSIDIELTPNRGDCLSMTGIAREIALANGMKIKPLKIIPVAKSTDAIVTSEVTEKAACPQYLTRVITNIKPQQKSPIGLQETLRRAGIRSIHPVVDITNYVMLELGQPMHAFDLATINQPLKVRYAKTDEKLTLLDGQEVTLSDDVLVIADKSQAIAMAGIMGGENTAVTDDTVDIVLESAYFAPQVIQGRARRYGLHTDASHRFERGVDFTIQQQAMERATDLIIHLLGGQAGAIQAVSSKADLPKRSKITLRQQQMKRLLGCDIPKRSVSQILKGLGMSLTAGKLSWSVTAPSYRFDITQEVDLIEEVARVYGYDNIPTQLPQTKVNILPSPSDAISSRSFAHLLKDLGYQEAMTYSFVNPKWQQALLPDDQALALSNPISPELSVMRSSLWVSLLPVLQANVKHQQQRVRLFEMGTRFIQTDGELLQQSSLAAVVIGDALPEQWGVENRVIDFYDVKADVEKLLALTGLDFQWQVAEDSALHPGRSAAIYYQQQCIGVLGELHPQLQQQFSLGRVIMFELNLSILSHASLIQYQQVSKYPAVRRDIAIVVENTVNAATISELIRESAGNLLNKLIIFDIYQGQGIAEGHKSLALGLILQAEDRTLVDDEINQLMDQVLQSLQQSVNASLRD